jgi:NAD(P)-dependent dehydrogenase (short-subunit alcohol dehydrogenase family)
MRLADKVVLITGAGSGLGRESSLLFAEEGAQIVAVDIDGQRAKDIATLVEERGGEAIAVTADVAVESQVEAAFAAAVDRFGRVDIAFANAGVTVPGRGKLEIDELTEAQWDEVVDVNLKGTFFTFKHAVREMKPRRTGTIVATSSSAAFVAVPGMNAYQATKGGVNALVIGLSLELGKYGIRINAICPLHGMSPNFFFGKGFPVVGKSYEEILPWDPQASPIPLKLPRPPSLRDNANVALFLASDQSAYLTGVCMPSADGGTLSKVAMEFPEDWLDPMLNSYLDALGFDRPTE